MVWEVKNQDLKRLHIQYSNLITKFIFIYIKKPYKYIHQNRKSDCLWIVGGRGRTWLLSRWPGHQQSRGIIFFFWKNFIIKKTKSNELVITCKIISQLYFFTFTVQFSIVFILKHKCGLRALYSTHCFMTLNILIWSWLQIIFIFFFAALSVNSAIRIPT